MTEHDLVLMIQRQRAALIAERDALRLQVAALAEERDALIATVYALAAKNEQINARPAGWVDPAGPYGS